MNRKRLRCLFLTLVMLFSMAVPVSAASGSLSNFKKQVEYSGFSDVPSNAWYAEGVKTVCEYGIMNGKSDTIFDPFGNISLAELFAIAARMHNTYYNNFDGFTEVDPWFAVYLVYADEYGIFSFDELPAAVQFSLPVTKEVFVQFITNALPESAYKDINHIAFGTLPGVSVYPYYADEIYALFNAGILTGSDSTGEFDSDERISRAEAATILSRILKPELRVKGAVEPVEFALWIPPAYVNEDGNIEMIANCGFLLDIYTSKNVRGSSLAWESGNKNNVYVDSIKHYSDERDNCWSVFAKTGSTNGTAELYFESPSGAWCSCDVEVYGGAEEIVVTPSSPAPTQVQTPSVSTTAQSAPTCNYIINTNTGKFHYSWCSSVKRMSESNKWYYTGTRDNVIDMGYVPCKQCCP